MRAPATSAQTHLQRACAAAMLLLSTCAWAQVYTAKVLPKPANALSCGARHASLDELGNVQARCSYKETNLLMYLYYPRPKTLTVAKTVVWRTGGAVQALSGGLGWGFNAAGQVIGVSSTNSPGIHALWKGTTKSMVPNPPGLSGHWRILSGRDKRAISHLGKAVLLAKTGSNGYIDINEPLTLAVVLGGAGQVLPPSPSQCSQQADSLASFTVNDVGQVGSMKLTSDNSDGTVIRYQPCLWTGAQWVVGPHMTSAPWPGDIAYPGLSPYPIDLSEDGTMLVSTPDQQAYLWPYGSNALTPVDGRVRALSANGDWVGGTAWLSKQTDQRATVWRQGTPIDLNTVSTGLPAGMTLHSALAANKRGQILTMSIVAGKSGDEVSLVLLTPR
jgi:hypothetical protein